MAIGNLMAETSLIQCLTQNGADLTAQDKVRRAVQVVLWSLLLALLRKDGNTPLHVAARLGCMEVAELLLSQNVDVNIVNKAKRTPLHAAVVGHRSVNLVKLLLAHGVDAFAVDVSQ